MSGLPPWAPRSEQDVGGLRPCVFSVGLVAASSAFVVAAGCVGNGGVFASARAFLHRGWSVGRWFVRWCARCAPGKSPQSLDTFLRVREFGFACGPGKTTVCQETIGNARGLPRLRTKHQHTGSPKNVLKIKIPPKYKKSKKTGHQKDI